MKHILVTGGAGFIGGHLIEALLSQGHHVHVVDNLSSNPIPHEQLIAELGNPANLTFEIANLLQWDVRVDRFDEMYHLSSPVGPAGILGYAGELAWHIIQDTYRVANLARWSKAKLVFVSTSEVYGGGQQGLCSEDMPCLIQADATVRLEYAVAKLAAEIAVLNTCKVKPLNALIVRPFNVAGPRQSSKGGFVLPRFIEQATSGQPLTVYGDGKQVRAFTHVKDIAQGLIQAMEHGQSGEVYNIGNPANRVTINTLAEWVNEITGGSGKVYVDPRAIHGPLFAEAADKYPDDRKARAHFGWNPTRDIATIIQDAYEYARKEAVR